MLNFIVVFVGQDKVIDAGRAITRRLNFRDLSIPTKCLENEGIFENMGFNGKTVWRFRTIKRTEPLYWTFQKNTAQHKELNRINWTGPS